MPLLHKQLFIPQAVPNGIPQDAQVYYCKPTKEVFLTHDEYFNRMILLNSTAWSCSLTRKSNLTYFEAVASEEEAERELYDFPEALELPILFIVHRYTNRGRFEELVSDVYHIMKDRFFNNEEVAYAERSRKFVARIVNSVPIKIENGNPMESGSEIKEPIMPPPESYRYTVELLDQSLPAADMFREHVQHDRLFRSKNVGARQKIRLFLKNCTHLPPESDHYIIKNSYIDKVDNLWWSDVMSGDEPICPQTPVQQRGRIPNIMKPGYVEAEKKEKKPKKEERDPNIPPRPRGRPPKTPEQKAQYQREKQMRKRQEAGRENQPDEFDLTSSGAMTLSVPQTSSPAKKKSRTSSFHKNEKKKEKILEQQEDLDFYFGEARRLGIDVTGLEQGEKLLSGKVVAEFKQKVRDEKDAERENIKEEKKRKIKEKAAYNKKREDLICNDLKPMPRFPALEIPKWMSNEEFSDYIFILQFFSSFKELLPLKEVRGNDDDIIFSDIVIAVKCNDPQNSPFADLMRVLLSIRTDIADEEDGDEADITNRDEIYLINTQNCDPVNVTHGDSIREISDLHFKIRKIHGKSVRHLPVDWMTLTEVLRLIFETSGYYTGISTHRHRLYARGNFRGYEDPAFEFRITQSAIMEKLKTQTVFDLEPNERLEIIKSIIYQLLTYSKFRIHLEKYQNELIELRKDQKKLKAWDVGQEGEANAARLILDMNTNGQPNGEKMDKDSPLVKRTKLHIKAVNEGRRYDKEDFDNILLDSVPYSSLSLDEIVTARNLQKTEYKNLMETLISKIFDIHCKVSDIRLGSDRGYRRYIVMKQLSTILVETPTTSELSISCDEASTIDDESNLSENEQQEIFICTGNTNTCLIHGKKRNYRTRWCYVSSCEQFENLLKSLNPRGNREFELLEELNEYRSNLLNILEEMEKEKEDEVWKDSLMTDDPDPADTYNIDWDEEMRDLLLDFEEKIDQGQMGSLNKVFNVDRIAWRDNLKNIGDVCILLNDNISILNEIAVDIDRINEYSDVKKLAVAFLMIIRSINLKFIKAPYISPNKDEHGNLKGSELFIRWQKALLQCQSLSALSLFISTFEGSIKWDKSRLQGKCKNCRRKAAAHELLLCSNCDNCFHLKCAKVNKDSETPTDWLCTTCRAQQRKEENEAKRKKRDEHLMESSQEEIRMVNMSINDTESEYPKGREEIHTETPSTSNQVNTIKTASGRTVKRVQYSDIYEGLSLKNRKSNGSTVASAPATPSERPIRNSSVRLLTMDENGLTDEDDDNSDDENTKRKTTAAANKSATNNDISRILTPNIKEKMAAIESLLKEAMRQEFSWPFLQPVDTKEVPDYYDVIKRPMDLRTIINKIKQRIYNKPAEVRSDFQLIISNCETYNETDSEIYQLAQDLHDFAAARLDAIIGK